MTKAANLAAQLVARNTITWSDVETACEVQLLYGGDMATNLVDIGAVEERRAGVGVCRAPRRGPRAAGASSPSRART